MSEKNRLHSITRSITQLGIHIDEVIGRAGLTPDARRRLREIRSETELLLKLAEHSGHDDDLTARQKEILSLCAEGATTREIAARLHISEATLKTHLQGIYRKFGVSNRVQALARARNMGLINDR